MEQLTFKRGDKLRIVQADSCAYGTNGDMKALVGQTVTVANAYRCGFHWKISVEENMWSWDETNVEKIDSFIELPSDELYSLL